jgi:uncharacterized Fe-S cluster protein YjdI
MQQEPCGRPVGGETAIDWRILLEPWIAPVNVVEDEVRLVVKMCSQGPEFASE